MKYSWLYHLQNKAGKRTFSPMAVAMRLTASALDSAILSKASASPAKRDQAYIPENLIDLKKYEALCGGG